MNQQEIRMISAFQKVVEKFPYYIGPISAIRMTDVITDPTPQFNAENIPTAGITPDYKLFFNSKWMEEKKLTLPQVSGLALHELEHNLRGHHQRMLAALEVQPIIPEVWNIACDLEINQDVRKVFPLPPEGALHDDPKFNFPPDLVAEQYYRLLEEKIEQNGGMSGKMLQDMIENGMMDQLLNSQEVNSSAETGTIDANIRKQVENDRENHERQRGEQAGGYKSKVFVEQKKFNWKRYVKNKIFSERTKIAGRSDYSYAQLSKLSMSNIGIVYPKWHSYKPEPLYIVLDTSGSMHNILNSCYGYLQNLLKTLPEFEVILIEVDTEIYVHNDLKRVPDVSSGGGGTDLTVAFQYILDQKKPASLIFCLTDMGTPWLSHPLLNNRTIVLTDDPDASWGGPCPYEVIKVEM